ncbi:hypothetical protein [Streptomyces sp. NBC_00726]|uniref:hypothetical protein n=1 Tax=Streptomyces sp. NBC_00726 TaxID=2903674 RepID=UPI00386D55EA
MSDGNAWAETDSPGSLESRPGTAFVVVAAFAAIWTRPPSFELYEVAYLRGELDITGCDSATD